MTRTRKAPDLSLSHAQRVGVVARESAIIDMENHFHRELVTAAHFMLRHSSHFVVLVAECVVQCSLYAALEAQFRLDPRPQTEMIRGVAAALIAGNVLLANDKKARRKALRVTESFMRVHFGLGA